jgi:hypothetical protein
MPSESRRAESGIAFSDFCFTYFCTFAEVLLAPLGRIFNYLCFLMLYRRPDITSLGSAALAEGQEIHNLEKMQITPTAAAPPSVGRGASRRSCCWCDFSFFL